LGCLFERKRPRAARELSNRRRLLSRRSHQGPNRLPSAQIPLFLWHLIAPRFRLRRAQAPSARCHLPRTASPPWVKCRLPKSFDSPMFDRLDCIRNHKSDTINCNRSSSSNCCKYNKCNLAHNNSGNHMVVEESSITHPLPIPNDLRPRDDRPIHQQGLQATVQDPLEVPVRRVVMVGLMRDPLKLMGRTTGLVPSFPIQIIGTEKMPRRIRNDCDRQLLLHWTPTLPLLTQISPNPTRMPWWFSI